MEETNEQGVLLQRPVAAVFLRTASCFLSQRTGDILSNVQHGDEILLGS